MRPLRMAPASIAIGAGGLAAFLIAQRVLYSGFVNDPDGWWTYLFLVGAGALTASVDRRPRSYFLAIGGTVVVSFAYLVWWAWVHGLGPFDGLIPVILLVVTVPAVLLGWLPIALALKARAKGSRWAWVPIAVGVIVLITAAVALGAKAGEPTDPSASAGGSACHQRVIGAPRRSAI